ncbi:MAG: hypothetical protein NUV88_02740 [Candidatus Kaiserbacteria bacterium]|nr:hypothetical protein [Candidatus Kaiserbacteria bacterium]
MNRPRVIVFASGTKAGGGSGFENLVQASGAGVLDADIAAVVSNHEHGGVRERANRLGIPFFHFNPPNYLLIRANKQVVGSGDLQVYTEIVHKSGAEWIALSGWLKQVDGLDPKRTFNIHPALLSQLGGRFGGKGMYGKHLYEAIKVALEAGEITESGFTMHFVTEEMDRGPAFFEFRVPLQKGMTAEKIAKAVNEAEREWQPKITNMVVRGEISWDGKNPASLIVPGGYTYLPRL